MKNKKVFTLLSLAMIGGVLVSCSQNKEQVLSYNRPFTKGVLKAEFTSSSESKVYLNENGQLLKINDPDDPKVNVLEDLKMSQAVASMYYSTKKTDKFNETLQLSVNGFPKKAPIGSLTWSSSNPAIASVDANGLVTALSEGTCDITAISEAGLSTKCHVVVNNTNVFLSDAVKSAKHILATQKSSDFEPINTIEVVEDYVGTKYIDGVPASVTKFSQTIWASVENAYFRIVSNDEKVLTAGGSVVPSLDSYIFYTTPTFFSYIFCNSDGKSNYMRLDQSYLVDEGKTPFQGLSEILQSFFVSGSSIMTNQYEDILSQDELDGGYGNPKYKGSLGETSGSFAYHEYDQRGGTIAPEDESDMGIPAGTRVTITDNIRYLWEDNLLSAKIIDEKLSYTLDGKNYVEEYLVNYYYHGRNVEVLWPDVSTYSQVDSIFDL